METRAIKKRKRRGRPPVQINSDSPSMAERIKDAAVELFFERSYPSTRMQDIAEACGVTAGALYNHYSSKDDLLYAIINEATVTVWGEFEAVLAKGVKNPTDELYKVIFTFAKYSAEHPHAALVTNTYFKFLSNDYRDEVLQQRIKVRKVFEDVVARGVDEGYFELPLIHGKRSVRLATIAMVDMVRHVAEWYKPDSEFSIQEVSDFYADLALKMVSAKRKRPSRKNHQ